jgi:leucyl aminopeptidase (aminopeptidase T)
MGVCSEILPGETGRLTVKDGILASAEGELGEMFWKILKARNEPNLYKMAELAVGLNPYTRVGLTALGAPNIPATIPPYHEVKMSEGTIHTAWGDSGGRFSTPGDVGTIATLHIDTVSFRPTLIIDGKTFVEDGKLLI